jgi:hypothetical protein
MLSAIRSTHRPATPITRVVAALPDLPHLHRKRHRRRGAAAIVTAVAGLLVVLISTAAVIFRDKLMSIVRRGDGGEAQAPDAAEHKLAPTVDGGDGKKEHTPGIAQT